MPDFVAACSSAAGVASSVVAAAAAFPGTAVAGCWLGLLLHLPALLMLLMTLLAWVLQLS